MKKKYKLNFIIPIISVVAIVILSAALLTYSNSLTQKRYDPLVPEKTDKPPEEKTSGSEVMEKPVAQNQTETKKEINPCNVKPGIAISPQSIRLAPNAKATFVAVVNNTEGQGCDPATFAVEVRAPANWEVKIFSSSYTLQWGDLGRTRIEARSNINSTAGNYTITAVVKNLNSSLSAEASSTYTVTGESLTTGQKTISGYSTYQ